jgi:hypothetical protein
MEIRTTIKQCVICGAITYIEINVDGTVGIPSGEPDKHAAWHETDGR